jgi:hypothetical protein
VERIIIFAWRQSTRRKRPDFAEGPLNPKTLSHEERIAWFKSLIPLSEGAEAVYIEYPTVAFVKVSQVVATEHGVEAFITDLLAPGMRRLNNCPCRIGNQWGGFGFSKGHWSAAPYVMWHLSFEAEMVELLREVAAAFERRGLTVSPQVARSILASGFEKWLTEKRAARNAGTNLRL